jgi:antitoxin component YwqK of YwqJK toxin-antitoxin module
MINGKPDGIWKTYYVTGVLKSTGKRINHLLDSIWVFFGETGDTTEKITYLLGKKNGYYYKYGSFSQKNRTKSNVVISKELFVNDNKEGLGFYYYPNGKLREVINYKLNKKSGFAKEFDTDSVLITIYEYYNDYLVDRQLLNRKQNDKPVGIWRDYYPNGVVKEEYSYKEGELNGYFKEYNEKGTLINNQLYRDGKMQTIDKSDTLDIEERITYFPDKKVKTRFYFKNKLPIGIHREYNERGDVINSWIYDNNGNLSGKGIIKDDGAREGKFSYFYSDGSVKSEGEYRNNLQQGKWLFYFKKGVFEQTGFFSNGYFNGEWKWFYPDSSLLRCENFTNGRRNGFYFELSERGDTVVRGFYKDNLKTGYWIIQSGDITEKGIYANDLKQGIWKAYYSNNVLMSVGNYIDGNPDGKHIFYYDNKFIKEEQFYVNGIKEKVWKKYNEDGTLFVSITYQGDIETHINGYKLAIIKGN